MVQVASVAGPALGGVVIATGGVAWVYAFNAASFLFVIARAADDADAEDEPGRPPEADGAGIRGNFTVAAALEGLRFVFRAPLIRSTMLLDFFATFFSSATALLPIFAQDILHVGARGYGWLYAAPAVGAVARQRLDDPRRRLDRAARPRAARRASPSTARRRSSSGCRARSG